MVSLGQGDNGTTAGKEKFLSFLVKYKAEYLRNTLNFIIFVYANKGFAYSMFNIRDPDGYKILMLWECLVGIHKTKNFVLKSV